MVIIMTEEKTVKIEFSWLTQHLIDIILIYISLLLGEIIANKLW